MFLRYYFFSHCSYAVYIYFYFFSIAFLIYCFLLSRLTKSLESFSFSTNKILWSSSKFSFIAVPVLETTIYSCLSYVYCFSIDFYSLMIYSCFCFIFYTCYKFLDLIDYAWKMRSLRFYRFFYTCE